MIDFKLLSERVIKTYKNNPDIKISIKGTSFYLKPMTYLDLESRESISLLSEWRKASEHAFLKIFQVTASGTEKWLKHGVLENKQRLMFWVFDSEGYKVGHIGVSSFNYDESSCEIDNVIKSPSCHERAIFTLTVETFIKWLKDELNPEKIKLRVFSENIKALSLYSRVGFKPVDIVTFKKVTGEDFVEWVESEISVDRCFLIMELSDDK